ncbi:MAG: hypothetical protein KAJ09_02060 [Deltaproteobacteria bacterium]|nr:hypothetical protein [Deltaproteobacteria bacterium]
MLKKSLVLLAHAFVGWSLCGLTMGIGMAATSVNTTLIIHAIAAPIIFSLVSSVYFRKFHYTSPIQTAIIFVSCVVLLDILIVALLIEKSFEMFASILGTWIPFILIFVSTYLTGVFQGK